MKHPISRNVGISACVALGPKGERTPFGSHAVLLVVLTLAACGSQPGGEDSLEGSSAAALAGTNLLGNPSFEASTTGWASWQGTLSRTSASDAPAGSDVAKVSRATGTAYSLDDTNVPVPSALGGRTYTAEVSVKAGATSSVGKPARLVIRERSAAGAFVKEWSSSIVPLSQSFAVLSATARPARGNQLDVYVAQEQAGAGDAFLADRVALVLEPEQATSTTPALELAAFPGASGGGSLSLGGRGGSVYRITSRADSGPGTLRDCVEDKSEPRTCVFAVSGTIELKSTLWITNPYLTVAGQTAPGGGIQITRAPGATIGALVLMATHDVTWQYTRLRHQYLAACSDAANSECGALLGVARGYNIVADHNSLSWNQDDGYGVWRGESAYEVRNVTMSMSLIAEGMSTHSTGAIFGGETRALSSGVTDVDFHHNLVMNNSHRNPLLKNKSGRVVNNIFYNQGFYVTQLLGGGQFDVIGNYYKRGPLNDLEAFHEIQVGPADDAPLGLPSLYLAGNVGWNQANPQGDQWSLAARVSGENQSEVGVVAAAQRRTTQLASSGKPIVAESVATISAANGSVVPTVGASRRLSCAGTWIANRDAVDSRLITQYTTNTGIRATIRTEAEAGGLPAIASGVACADTDADGMPDEWETGHGLSPSNAIDRNGKRAAARGFTNLELYLSGMFPNGVSLP